MSQITDTTPTASQTTTEASFGKRFAALFALGMVGVLAVGISTATGEGGVPGLPDVSTPVLAVLVMVQPVLLLALAVAVGTLLAPASDSVRTWTSAFAAGRRFSGRSVRNSCSLSASVD